MSGRIELLRSLVGSFINSAARIGPAAKLWRQTDEYKEALACIDWEMKCKIYNRQRRCNHIKGGKFRPRVGILDYNVTTHTFIDGRTRIQCVLCGTEAYSNSGWDFKFAWLRRMAESSTNRPSSSEQVQLEVKCGKALMATFPDTPTGREALRKRFPEWDGTVNPYMLMDVTKEDDALGIPEGHSPIKGVEASTPEAGPDSPGAIIVNPEDGQLGLV